MAAPRKDDVKELILDAVQHMMEKQAISDISLASVARAAGISKGTLYYHYRSKDDILFDVADRYLHQQWADLLAWTEDVNKDTSLHRLVKYVLERNVAAEGLRMHLVCSAMLGNDTLRDKLNARYQAFAQIIAQKIGERTTAVNAAYLTWLILLSSDGLIIQKNLAGGELDVEHFIAMSGELIRSME